MSKGFVGSVVLTQDSAGVRLSYSFFVIFLMPRSTVRCLRLRSALRNSSVITSSTALSPRRIGSPFPELLSVDDQIVFQANLTAADRNLLDVLRKLSRLFSVPLPW